jgi:hypothetical protein
MAEICCIYQRKHGTSTALFVEETAERSSVSNRTRTSEFDFTQITTPNLRTYALFIFKIMVKKKISIAYKPVQTPYKFHIIRNVGSPTHVRAPLQDLQPRAHKHCISTRRPTHSLPHLQSSCLPMDFQFDPWESAVKLGMRKRKSKKQRFSDK